MSVIDPENATAPVPLFMPPFQDLRKRLASAPSSAAVIKFTVSEKGDVVDISAKSSSDAEFAKLAISYVKRMKFRPGSLKGKPMSCTLNLPFGKY